MKGQRSTSVDDVKKIFARPKKEQANLLKEHPLLQTCWNSKDEKKKEVLPLPKVGELVWARVTGSVFWPGFIVELDDIEGAIVEGADKIDDSAYGFVVFLEKTYRYAPISWYHMIPFRDIETQMKLLPHFNKLVVKKTWKPTKVYKTALEMATDFLKMSVSERLETAISRYEAVKKEHTPKAKKPRASNSSQESSTEETKPDIIPPKEAINKVMSAVREKKKSGIRVSDRITEKNIVKLKPTPEPKSTASTKKTENTSEKKSGTKNKGSNKNIRNPRPETRGEVLKEWIKDRFNSFPKQHVSFESSNPQCGECNLEVLMEDQKLCHGLPYHRNCLKQIAGEVVAYKCGMCIDKLCFICKMPSDSTQVAHKCSRCELRFHIDCLTKDWPQAEIQGSNGPITCPIHFCHTCLGEQKVDLKFRDYTTNPSRSYRCRLCLSNYHKTCLPAGCGENVQGKDFIVCPKHTLPELKVHQRRIGCLTCCKPLKPKDDRVECTYCVQMYHPECVGYDDEARRTIPLEVFKIGYKCYPCKWGLFPLYGQMIWFQQPQSQYWPARILFPVEHKSRKNVKRLPGQYSIEYFGSTSFYDNASRAIPFHLTSVDVFKTLKVYQEIPKILRAHEEAEFCILFYKEFRDKQLPPPKPVYKKIERNVYRTFAVHKVKPRDRLDPCLCAEEKTELVCQADSGCSNRNADMECNDHICTGKERCCNRMFSERKEDEKFLEPKLFPNKGWGVIAKNGFKPGDFVSEYRGEMIDRNEKKWRLNRKEEEDAMYILEMSKEYFIDAEYVGNLSRLINHSCDPNCEVRKYVSLGRSVGGIFAKRVIEIGEEVTFNYGCGSQSTAAFRCRCGAENCIVFVGKDVPEGYSPEDYSPEDDPEQNQDKWDDVCSKCSFPGRVICCDFPGCKKVYHYKCVGLKRQPGKHEHWCCHDHPEKQVAQLMKTIQARKRSGKSKVTKRKSTTNLSASKVSGKTHGPSEHPVKKKLARHSREVPEAGLDPHNSLLTMEEAMATANSFKGANAVSVPIKRKLSEVNSSIDSSQPPPKKQRSTCSTASKSEGTTSSSEKQPNNAFRHSLRHLRSSRMSTLAEQSPNLVVSPTPVGTIKSEALVVLRRTLVTPVTAAKTKLSAGPRHRRAKSNPVDKSYFGVPGSQLKATKRFTREPRRIYESAKKLDDPNNDGSLEASSMPEMRDDRPVGNKVSCSDKDLPTMSRRRSRNNRPPEPFSPLALNVLHRQLAPVHLSSTLASSNKHVRMGTRSTSGTFLESPPYNQMSGEDQVSNDLFSNNMNAVLTFTEIKQEVVDPGFPEGSMSDGKVGEETNNNNERKLYDDGSDTESNSSTPTEIDYNEVSDYDSEIEVIGQFAITQALLQSKGQSVRTKSRHREK